jgi:CubicO group peptidase (beta-lactamase class C family)
MFLQMVVAELTGQEPAEWIRENLLEPLGLRH